MQHEDVLRPKVLFVPHGPQAINRAPLEGATPGRPGAHCRPHCYSSEWARVLH